MVMYASEDSDTESDKENDNPQLQILVGDVKEHVNVEYQPDNKDEMGKIEESKPCQKGMRPHRQTKDWVGSNISELLKLCPPV